MIFGSSNKIKIKMQKRKITNRTCYIFNDMINIEDFDSNLMKIEQKLYKNVDIYYIGYIIIKKK